MKAKNPGWKRKRCGNRSTRGVQSRRCVGLRGDGSTGSGLNRAHCDCFSLVHPFAEFRRGIGLRRREQSGKMKRGIVHAKTGALGVAGIQILLEMIFDGNEKQRLAEIGTFAYGFEPGGAGNAAGSSHHTQKFFAMNFVEGEVRVVIFLIRSAGFIVEAMNGDVGILFVPFDDFRGVTVVEQINEQVAAGKIGVQLEQLAAKDRRTDKHLPVGQIGSIVKRQGQPGRTNAGHGDVKLHAELLRFEFLFLHEIRVLEHVLMAHDENGNFVPMQQIANTHERFQKIDDEVWLSFLNCIAQCLETTAVRRQVAKDIRERADERNAAMLFERKAGADDGPHRHRKCLLKKCRQVPRLVRPGGYRHDLMTTPLQHLVHRDRLRHVSPPFALHCEH